MLKIMKKTLVFFVFTCVMGLMFTNASAQEVSILSWVKNNAGWWATDQIDDKTFVNGIQHLIKVGIIIVEQTENSWHILDEVNFVTSPSDIKLFDTTIIAEASFSKQVKIRFLNGKYTIMHEERFWL